MCAKEAEPAHQQKKNILQTTKWKRVFYLHVTKESARTTIASVLKFLIQNRTMDT